MSLTTAIIGSYQRAWREIYKRYTLSTYAVDYLLNIQYYQYCKQKEYLAINQILEHIGVNSRHRQRATRRINELVNGGFLQKIETVTKAGRHLTHYTITDLGYSVIAEFESELSRVLAEGVIFYGWAQEFVTPNGSYKLDELPPQLLKIGVEEKIKYAEKVIKA